MSTSLNQAEVFATLPPPWSGDALESIHTARAAAPHKVWILDDDPTGTQTVADIPVLTHWDTATLRAEFDQPHAGCFILTNSRGLPAENSRSLHRHLGRNLKAAAGERSFSLISRSDSTLRGHFPLETDVLADVFGAFDLVLLTPFFEAGGRFTINDVHYVSEAGQLVPAADTPFARDSVFGYKHSALPAWVEEKTAGEVAADDAVSLSLSLIRREGPAGVTRALLAAPTGSVVVVNAVSQADMEVVAAGVLATETAGRRVIARSAAAYAAARLGQRPPPLLRGPELTPSTPHGGLIVAGSHVPKTTAQLNCLRAQHDLTAIELSVEDLLYRKSREVVITEAVTTMNAALQAGRDVLVFTSREVVTSSDAKTNLEIGADVSRALIKVVQGVCASPRFLIAKGGVTSSDVATEALGVKRAMIRGQIMPGVPVWMLGSETRFPGLGYIVFPGNVGDDQALADTVTKLTPPAL